MWSEIWIIYWWHRLMVLWRKHEFSGKESWVTCWCCSQAVSISEWPTWNSGTFKRMILFLVVSAAGPTWTFLTWGSGGPRSFLRNNERLWNCQHWEDSEQMSVGSFPVVSVSCDYLDFSKNCRPVSAQLTFIHLHQKKSRDFFLLIKAENTDEEQQRRSWCDRKEAFSRHWQ